MKYAAVRPRTLVVACATIILACLLALGCGQILAWANPVTHQNAPFAAQAIDEDGDDYADEEDNEADEGEDGTYDDEDGDGDYEDGEDVDDGDEDGSDYEDSGDDPDDSADDPDGGTDDSDEDADEKSFEDGKVYVSGIVSNPNTVIAYDSKSKRLELRNASFTAVSIKISGVTVFLNGANTSQEGIVACGDDDEFVDLTVIGSATGKDSLTMEDGNISCRTLNLKSCTITNDGSEYVVVCSGDAKMAEATVNGTIGIDGNLTLDRSTVVGSIDCQSLDMTGGSVTAWRGDDAGIRCDGPVTLKGGTINLKSEDGMLSCRGLTVNGTTIKSNNSPIECDGIFNMMGGTIAMTGAEGYLLAAGEASKHDFTVSGGTISTSGTSGSGITVSGGNLTVSGGTVKVLNAGEAAIAVSSDDYGKSKPYGGKVTAYGGKVTATLSKGALKSKGASAINAESMANSTAVLVSIAGKLPFGATFKTGGNTYSVTQLGAAIASYGAKSAKATFDKVKFGGHSYAIDGVKAKAFNTSTGKKLKTIAFKQELHEIDGSAFAGTAALTSLTVHLPIDSVMKKGKVTSVKLAKSASVGKKAFAGCGKSNGKGLTVKLLHEPFVKSNPAPYKKFLKKYGLSAKAKIAGLA